MPYIADNTDDEIIRIKSLEEASAALLQWFTNNFLKNNSDKCWHLLISSNEMQGLKLTNMTLKTVSVRNYLASK